MSKPELRLLPMRAVIEKCGISRAGIYRRLEAGTFPIPVPLSERGRAWRSDELDAWIEAESAKRRPG